MNKNKLCYCILTLQYVKRHCVAGYLLEFIMFCVYPGPIVLGLKVCPGVEMHLPPGGGTCSKRLAGGVGSLGQSFSKDGIAIL